MLEKVLFQGLLTVKRWRGPLPLAIRRTPGHDSCNWSMAAFSSTSASSLCKSHMMSWAVSFSIDAHPLRPNSSSSCDPPWKVGRPSAKPCRRCQRRSGFIVASSLGERPSLMLNTFLAAMRVRPIRSRMS
ncbi:hypothetical protein MRB53_038653 [Persea americana]|nr:hypothetical protein MRB53_038653 [Persea americana]